MIDLVSFEDNISLSKGEGEGVGKKSTSRIVSLTYPLNVHLLQLDTSSKESIARVTNEIKKKYCSQLDININNATIASKQNTVQTACESFTTNY